MTLEMDAGIYKAFSHAGQILSTIIQQQPYQN